GIVADQGERGEAPGLDPDLLRQPRERLERGVLRHPQVEADPVLQRAVVDRLGWLARRGRAVAARAVGPALRRCSFHRSAAPVSPARKDCFIPNYPAFTTRRD